MPEIPVIKFVRGNKKGSKTISPTSRNDFNDIVHMSLFGSLNLFQTHGLPKIRPYMSPFLKKYKRPVFHNYCFELLTNKLEFFQNHSNVIKNRNNRKKIFEYFIFTILK